MDDHLWEHIKEVYFDDCIADLITELKAKKWLENWIEHYKDCHSYPKLADCVKVLDTIQPWARGAEVIDLVLCINEYLLDHGLRRYVYEETEDVALDLAEIWNLLKSQLDLAIIDLADERRSCSSLQDCQSYNKAKGIVKSLNAICDQVEKPLIDLKKEIMDYPRYNFKDVG